MDAFATRQDAWSVRRQGRVMVHFRVDLDGRVFAACAPYLTVAHHCGLRLAVHAVLITCPRCKELVQAARALTEGGM